MSLGKGKVRSWKAHLQQAPCTGYGFASERVAGLYHLQDRTHYALLACFWTWKEGKTRLMTICCKSPHHLKHGVLLGSLAEYMASLWHGRLDYSVDWEACQRWNVVFHLFS